MLVVLNSLVHIVQSSSRQTKRSGQCFLVHSQAMNFPDGT